MVGQQLPQINEKCYNALQCPMWFFLPPFYGSKHSQVYDAGCCCRWVQTSKANLRTVWIGLDRPLVFLPSFGYLQTNGTAQNMGRASPWAADLTEAAALLFSSSRVPMVNSSPHHPLRLSLSILPSPVVLLILGTCFVLHTARRFYIVLSSRTEHCWRAGEKAGRSVIDSILLDRTDCLVPSSRSNMLCVVQEKDCRNPESWSATPFLSSVSKWLQIGLGMPGAREMRLLIVT